ncbi:cytochrome P450 2B4-like [Ovis aries]|uniref:cytochrome P450 2B4-like n=1 Tax=Ovis aries TaxID=9940 RepID=UPI00100E145C|nr:cytochrome P450 2B4-like [Ovis aries]
MISGLTALSLLVLLRAPATQGTRPAVVLCRYAALRDALVLQADAFSGRGATAIFERFTRGNGIAFSEGPRWPTLRHFALGALKEFGLGTRSVEECVLEEAACLLGEFQATGDTAWKKRGTSVGVDAGAPFNPRQLLDNAVSNVICSVVFGNHYGYEDMEFLRLLDLFNYNFCIMSSRCTFSPPSWTGSQAHITEYSETSLRVFLSQQMQLHQQTRQPGKPHYFIHSFLDQIDKVQGPAALNSSPAAHQQAPGTQQHLSSVPTGTENPESHFQAEMLVMTTHNLFFGGTEITGTTLRYGLLILLKYAEVLSPGKVPAELDGVAGRMRAQTLEDREYPLCTNTVLHEIQRFISVVSFGLPRKRMCLGAGLAPTEIFLTSILLRFFLLPVGSHSDTDLTPQCTGPGNVPPAFQLRLVAH